MTSIALLLRKMREPSNLHYGEDQVTPPSRVEKRVPFLPTIDALLESVAVSAVKLCREGGLMSCQCAPPSSVRMMVPDFPTIQHTSLDGADAASRFVVTPLRCATHPVALVHREIFPERPNCHPTLRSGE